MSSGTESQLSVGAETAYAVQAATPTAYEFLNESITLDIERIESQGLRNNRYIQHAWRAGNRKVGGSLSMELAPQGLGFWLSRMLGDAGVTTGAGPYEHVFIPGDYISRSFTAEVARPRTDGTLEPFQFVGGFIDTWDLSLTNNEILELSFDMFFADEILGTSGVAAAAAYPAQYLPFSSLDAVLTVEAADSLLPPTELCISDLSISGTSGLDLDRFRTCTDGNLGRALEPRPNGRREISGSITLDFESLDQYNIFRNSQEGKIVLTATQGTNTLVFDINARYDAVTNTVSGVERLTQEIEFMAVSDVSDADALTITLTNDDPIIP